MRWVSLLPNRKICWKTNEFILISNVTLIHPPSFHYAVQCTKKADCSTVQGKPECSPLKTCGELVVIDFCLRILNWKRPKTRWIFKWVKNEFIFSKGFIVFTAGFFYQNCKKTHGEIILPKFNKLRSVKLRALDFTTLNFSSDAIWIVLTWQSLQQCTKLLSQYFGIILKQLIRQNKSNSIGRKIQGGEIQGPKWIRENKFHR